MTVALTDLSEQLRAELAAELARNAPPLAPRLRAMPVPDTEPAPDLQPDPRLRGRRRLVTQPTLALSLVPPPGPGRPTAPAAAPWPQPITAGLPDPQVWSRRVMQAVVEVLCGVRPVAQLVRWTNRDVYEGLRRRSGVQMAGHGTPGHPEAGRRAVVRSVRICQPADGVVEAAAVVAARGRIQAVAFRLEGADGRWRMTALELG
jgi:hypothetical protein